MHFTPIGRSVDTMRVYDMYDKLLDNMVVRRRCVLLAQYILWYETVPAIIGKKKSNDGLSKEEDEDEEGEICSICYDKFQADQMIGTLGCRHSYHEGCIKNWLSRKKAKHKSETKASKAERICVKSSVKFPPNANRMHGIIASLIHKKGCYRKLLSKDSRAFKNSELSPS
ncbi:zinc finger, RING/FYVE/PHD-type containing protein [Tanacetum coccineum]